jgi:hypothetical protein
MLEPCISGWRDYLTLKIKPNTFDPHASSFKTFLARWLHLGKYKNPKRFSVIPTNLFTKGTGAATRAYMI